eukprot:COSAG02_NODE_39_length_48074_cov_106.508890_21_plen_221_part_00
MAKVYISPDRFCSPCCFVVAAKLAPYCEHTSLTCWTVRLMHVPRAGPSRWHPPTCTGKFIDALKYDTARAIGPEAARAAAERAARSPRQSTGGSPSTTGRLSLRSSSRVSTGGSQSASGGSRRSGSSPRAETTSMPLNEQKGCAKCGEPMRASQETTWARHGPKVGLHYHKRCRDIPWPDPAQVALYTGIPECSSVRKPPVKLRISKCNVCGQGKRARLV